jgi:Cysteine rich repeat
MQKRRSILVVFAGAVVFSLVGAAGAWAADAQPCRADIAKLCKGVPQGGGKIRDCLRKHTSELSAGCKAKMDAGQGIFAGGGEAMIQACGEDAKKLCPGVEAGSGRVRQCLSKHLSEVSGKCKAHLEKTTQGARRRGAGFRMICHDELDKLCKGIPTGGGRLIECLTKHDAELSQACREAVGKAGPSKPAQSKTH